MRVCAVGDLDPKIGGNVKFVDFFLATRRCHTFSDK